MFSSLQIRSIPMLSILLAATLACGEKPSTKNVQPATDAAKSKEAPAKAKEAPKANAPKANAPSAKEAEKPQGPHPDQAKATAPDVYKVLFSTTKGDILIDIDRGWAPNGADRLYNLVKIGYFEDIAFFRAIGGFMVQFGIHGSPAVANDWRTARIDDDPVIQSNTRGMLTFATSGKNSRTTQIFINYGDNANLDGMGFSPLGMVSEEHGVGMGGVDALFTGYGEGAPRGKGPNQGLIQTQGNTYLKAQYPKLDYIVSARICGEGAPPPNAPEWCK
jgi:peptidyl-prolyl cis-trans isomerase A (cyclophilin A)